MLCRVRNIISARTTAVFISIRMCTKDTPRDTARDGVTPLLPVSYSSAASDTSHTVTLLKRSHVTFNQCAEKHTATRVILQKKRVNKPYLNGFPQPLTERL